MNEKEIEAMILKYQDKLQNYRLCITNYDVAESEDVVQETFSKIWAKKEGKVNIY